MKYLFSSQEWYARLSSKVLIKGSVYPFSPDICVFLIIFFSGLLETTCVSCYTVSGRSKFPIFGLDRRAVVR